MIPEPEPQSEHSNSDAQVVSDANVAPWRFPRTQEDVFRYYGDVRDAFPKFGADWTQVRSLFVEVKGPSGCRAFRDSMSYIDSPDLFNLMMSAGDVQILLCWNGNLQDSIVMHSLWIRADSLHTSSMPRILKEFRSLRRLKIDFGFDDYRIARGGLYIPQLEELELDFFTAGRFWTDDYHVVVQFARWFNVPKLRRLIFYVYGTISNDGHLGWWSLLRPYQHITSLEFRGQPLQENPLSYILDVCPRLRHLSYFGSLHTTWMNKSVMERSILETLELESGWFTCEVSLRGFARRYGAMLPAGLKVLRLRVVPGYEFHGHLDGLPEGCKFVLSPVLHRGASLFHEGIHKGWPSFKYSEKQ